MRKFGSDRERHRRQAEALYELETALLREDGLSDFVYDEAARQRARKLCKVSRNSNAFLEAKEAAEKEAKGEDGTEDETGYESEP